MKSKKKFALIILAGMILAAFCGCQRPEVRPGDTSSEAPAQAPTEAPVSTDAPTAEPALEPAEDHPLPEDPDEAGDCVKDAEVLFHMPFEVLTEIPSGADDDRAGFKEIDDVYNDVELGPQSFAVVDGKVYLLDTLKNRIVISDNGRISTIPTSNYPERMCVIGGVIYTSLRYTGGRIPMEIIPYDMEGNELERIALPEDIAVYRLTEYEGKIAVLAYGGSLYALEDGNWAEKEKGILSRIENGTYSFEVNGGETAIRFEGSRPQTPTEAIWTDSLVYLAVMGTEPGDNSGRFDYCYQVYDFDGNLVGSTYADPRSALFYPGNPMFIGDDDTLYVMCWMQDGVYITKPNLRMEYVPHLDETIETNNG